MTDPLAIVAVVVIVVCLPSLVLLWVEERRAYTLTDAGERAAAQAVEGNTSVITWDACNEKYVRATRHPAGFVHIEILDESVVGEMLAREVGVA